MKPIFFTLFLGLLSTSWCSAQEGTVGQTTTDCAAIQQKYFPAIQETLGGLPLATLIHPAPNSDSVHLFLSSRIDVASLKADMQDTSKVILQLYIIDDQVECIFIKNQPHDLNLDPVLRVIKGNFVIRSYSRSGRRLPSRLDLLLNFEKLLRRE